MFSQLLVSYDIENDKSRRKVYQELKNIGLFPIQRSVFWGYVLPSEKKSVRDILKKYCKDADKAFLTNVQLDKDEDNLIGYEDSEFLHPESFEVI